MREWEVEKEEIEICLACPVVPDCVGIYEKRCILYQKRRKGLEVIKKEKPTALNIPALAFAWQGRNDMILPRAELSIKIVKWLREGPDEWTFQDFEKYCKEFTNQSLQGWFKVMRDEGYVKKVSSFKGGKGGSVAARWKTGRN